MKKLNNQYLHIYNLTTQYYNENFTNNTEQQMFN